MKKLLLMVSVLAVCLMFAGCCTLTAADGTVTKSFPNCFKIAQDKVCNAPENVMALANLTVGLAEAALSMFVPGSAEYIAALGAYGTATTIQQRGCAFLTDLNAMIAFLQSPAAQQAQTKMLAGKKSGPTTINVQPLIDWRDSAK